MTTNQTAPVTDEELDQMIWKLERDGGMTPKMLSLMRELREVRRAVTPTDDERIMAIEGIASPAPVVPGVIATDDISYSVGRFRTHRDCYRDGWNACRAAMLNHSGDATDMVEPVSNRDELPAKCWCKTCRPVTMNDMRFVVCPECGNKRCPRANDHRNACTGSNAPGQDGSAYPAEPKEVG